jgi:hypothetical protein
MSQGSDRHRSNDADLCPLAHACHALIQFLSPLSIARLSGDREIAEILRSGSAQVLRKLCIRRDFFY